MSYAVANGDVDGLRTFIVKQDLQLASIRVLDGARAVGNHESTAGVPTTATDLDFPTRSRRHGKASADENRGAGLNLFGLGGKNI